MFTFTPSGSPFSSGRQLEEEADVTMRQSVSDIWTEFNTPLEGRLNFMYLDIKGLVTTGMGNLIDTTGPPPLRAPSDAERSASHAEAETLQWLTADGAVATPDQIDAEWDQIKARTDQAQSGGGTFRQFATLFLSDNEINRIVLDKLSQMEIVLKSRAPFIDFDSFPADAQLGLLSMSWGMGPMFNFPKFQDFVASGVWDRAAGECRFQPDTGTITIRNDRDQLLFTNAAAVIKNGRDPDTLVWPATA